MATTALAAPAHLRIQTHYATGGAYQTPAFQFVGDILGSYDAADHR